MEERERESKNSYDHNLRTSQKKMKYLSVSGQAWSIATALWFKKIGKVFSEELFFRVINHGYAIICSGANHRLSSWELAPGFANKSSKS